MFFSIIFYFQTFITLTESFNKQAQCSVWQCFLQNSPEALYSVHAIRKAAQGPARMLFSIYTSTLQVGYDQTKKINHSSPICSKTQNIPCLCQISLTSYLGQQWMSFAFTQDVYRKTLNNLEFLEMGRYNPWFFNWDHVGSGFLEGRPTKPMCDVPSVFAGMSHKDGPPNSCAFCICKACPTCTAFVKMLSTCDSKNNTFEMWMPRILVLDCLTISGIEDGTLQQCFEFCR